MGSFPCQHNVLVFEQKGLIVLLEKNLRSQLASYMAFIAKQSFLWELFDWPIVPPLAHI